jgi:glycosyltransferase involved in cell wall biosynthesis
MIGRGDDRTKRLDLGIEAMQFIAKDLPESKMIIISDLDQIDYLLNLTEKLNLEENIKFTGYHSNPEIFYKNASLHIFPTLVEAFPNVLSETLIYGIPTILVGLDYVSAAKGGTVIIYDDSPLSIAKIATKILLNQRLRKKLGQEARENIKKYRNDLLLNKYVELIISIYKGNHYYEELRRKDKKINKKEYLRIMKNQIISLRVKDKNFENITIKDIEKRYYLEKLKID